MKGDTVGLKRQKAGQSKLIASLRSLDFISVNIARPQSINFG